MQIDLGCGENKVPGAVGVDNVWADPTHKMAFTFGSAEFFDVSSAKAYYTETASIWNLVDTSARVTWFNWKRYRMRRIDAFLSRFPAAWLNWLLKQPNLPGSADLLVKALPFFFVEIRWDNSPNTVYEAMAAGKAVVASRVGGIPELVADGETGLLVPVGDSRALAEAIVRLLLSDEMRIRMEKRGREDILRIADLGVNVSRREALYARLANGAGNSL